MSNFEKLKLLVWKNFVLQKRHKWQTIFEIASPVIFSLLLVLIRCLVHPEAKPDMSYPPFNPTYVNMTKHNLGDLAEEDKVVILAFSPENNMTRSVVDNVLGTIASDNLGFFLGLVASSMIKKSKGFKNAEELENALIQHNAMKTYIAGIQFDDNLANVTQWPNDVVVSLRFPAVMRTPMVEHPLRASWRTNILFPLFPQPGPRDPGDAYGGKTPGYSPEMFLAIQQIVSKEIIKQKSGKPYDARVTLRRMPQVGYIEDQLLMALERFVSMIIMLCFSYTFVNTVRMVTAEKELQLKETMTIMGLPSWLHWLAWFIKQFSFLIISIIFIVILFKIPFTSPSGHTYSIFTYTPWSVLLFFMVLFVIVSLAFSFMVSVFFTKANTAASFMGLAWLTTYTVYMLTQVLSEDISFTTRIVLCLISNTAMGYAFQMIVISEGTGQGLRWGDFFTPISYQDPFLPGHVVFLLLLDAVMYMLIAMYVEKIKPGSYGVPLPWYFPFTKSFWMPNPNKIAEITSEETMELKPKNRMPNVVHDEEPSGVHIGVDIQNLCKIYKKGKKVVDNLNLRMYENEITVLLGHNGAGKTTTISMMTGMVPPTSGTAIINGYDIVQETKLARNSVGICPQHNVLFPDLTVAEHIIFYSKLKGVPEEKIADEVDHFVKLLELQDKRNVMSENLSGGQKRRLSVGAAMCGSSRVVLLDEPTSGLDPAARRALWDLLQREKRGRTVVLTTHFMDEADVLGDRIAIMAGGRLQCVGTPYFLKKHYGMGYRLTIVKKDDCDVNAVTQFFKNHISNIKENTNIGSELSYILPGENVSRFPVILREFEEKKESLRVSGYGLTVTNLEEVFMKAGAEDLTEAGHDTSAIPMDQNMLAENEIIEKVKGTQLLKNHIKAMFLKLAYNALRNKLTAFIQIVTPIMNIIMSIALVRSWDFMSELPPLALNLESGFVRTETLVSASPNLTDTSIENKIMMAYKDYFKSSGRTDMIVNDIGTMDFAKYYLKLSNSELARVRYENLVGATFAKNNITSWFSNYGYHDSAISLSLMNNAIMRALSPMSSLKFINSPLPYSIENLISVLGSRGSIGFQFAFNIGFGMAFVTAFFVIFAVKERVSGAKLLQRVSGVRPAVMWGCALLWDWAWLTVVNVCIVATLACFQESTFATAAELGRVFLVLVAFSIAVIPVNYLFSFRFDTPGSGFSRMCFLNIFLGAVPFLVSEVLRFPNVGSPELATKVDWLFSPLPIYSLCRSFRDLSVSSLSLQVCGAICTQYDSIKNCSLATLCNKHNISVCCIDEDPYLKWSEPGIGRYLFMMILVGIVVFTLLLLVEYEFFKRIGQKLRRAAPPPAAVAQDADDDVAAERSAVRALARRDAARYSLVCDDLTKYYGGFLAVDRLAFAVDKKECFGLLGINGAGKTSTFRMLTGDSSISAGDAFVHGLSVRQNLREVHQHIGYCPQFDALFDNLTARETLRIFCLLRGIPTAVGAARAAQLAELLGFTRHFDKKINECSGGTKRKVSTAVAFLGDSSLVFLDEPTTGMDPASKRLVWRCVSEAAAAGRSVVLTSHSMEECEALCSRLTVMVGGRLHCLGPLQHLKNKFSQGYTLIVKCKPGSNRDKDVEDVKIYVNKTFADTQFVESYLGISTFYLKELGLPWWRIFHSMEEARSTLSIEDYSVSQTSLEQVFMNFARMYARPE